MPGVVWMPSPEKASMKFALIVEPLQVSSTAQFGSKPEQIILWPMERGPRRNSRRRTPIPKRRSAWRQALSVEARQAWRFLLRDAPSPRQATPEPLPVKRSASRCGKARHQAPVDLVIQRFGWTSGRPAAIFRQSEGISTCSIVASLPEKRPKFSLRENSRRGWPVVYAALKGRFQTEPVARTAARLRGHRRRFPCRPYTPVGRPRALVSARHRNAQRAPAFDRGCPTNSPSWPDAWG